MEADTTEQKKAVRGRPKSNVDVSTRMKEATRRYYYKQFQAEKNNGYEAKVLSEIDALMNERKAIESRIEALFEKLKAGPPSTI